MKVILFFLLSACSFIPSMEKVDSPVPGKLPNSLAPGVEEQDDPITLGWKEFYQDKELQALIQLALEHNRDLRIAGLSVEEVRAQYAIQKSQLLPTVELNGSWTRRKIPENAVFSQNGGRPADGGFVQEQFALEVGITAYELDFFGRIRSLKEAALQEYLASEAARDSVRITLISEVASSYLRLLINRELEELARQMAKLQEDTVSIIEGRYKGGVASELELRQAQTLLEEARADAIFSSRQVAQDVHALSLLLGKVISAESITQKFSDVTSKFGKIPVNLRSETLLKRPDIRMAERQLLSANANIGAARAAFFPSVSLTSNVGKISTDLNDLFESNSNSWLFMPQISVPIFTGGRHKAALDLIKVRKERRIVEYEQAIQAAFREASDALVSNEKLYQAIQAQAQVVDAARRAHRIGMLRYQEGVENYLVALDALRELYIAQRGHLLGQYQYFSNLGFLYRALGGGLEH